MILQKQSGKPDRVIIDKKALAQIYKEIDASYPREACGVLFSKEEIRSITGFSPLENYSGDTHSYFQVDPLEMYRLELKTGKTGQIITGFYHSHPDAPAIVSGEDESFMIPGMVYLIISIDEKGIQDVKAWQKQSPDDRASEIIVVLEED